MRLDGFYLGFQLDWSKGTIDVMGSNYIPAKTRYLSVVGGTGDFFMARGILEIETDGIVPFEYFN